MPEPAEAQFAREYITYADVFGRTPTAAELDELLRATGLHSVVTNLSFINSVLYVKGTLRVQVELVNATFADDIKTRIRQLPRLETRALYSPAQLLFVMKTAILHSPDHSDTRANNVFGRAMNEALLMANDLIDADLAKAVEGVSDPEEIARMLLPHSVRSTLINAADAHDTTLPRASVLFTDVANRPVVRERAGAVAFDVDARFRALTGLSLREYFALGWMLLHWFATGARQPRDYPDNRSLNPDTFFSSTRLDPSVGSSLLRRLTHDYVSLKAAIEKRLSAGRLFAYDFVPFMDRPLYQVRPDHVVPTSLPFLASRLSTGVYWILFDGMSSTEREGWSSYYGHILEAYVRDVVERLFQTRRDSTVRVLPDQIYRVGRREMRTSDLVALYPDSAIFFEVTATRIRMEATRLMEDPAAVEDDLQKIVLKKARQLNDRIADFQRGAYELGGTKAGDINHILPVVVTGEPIPLWTTTARSIRHELSKDKLLQQAGVEPLRIVAVDEVEMLEALAQTGVDPLVVIRSHSGDPDLRNVSLRNYLQIKYDVPANQSLRTEYLRIGNEGARLLFDTHLGPPTHDEIAQRAYEIFERRGRQQGYDMADWLEAERELMGKTK